MRLVFFKSEKLLRSQRAASKFTVLVFSILVGAGLFCAYHILPFYYCYYEIQSHMDQMVRVASTLTDQEVRARLWYQIKHLGIPVEEEDLKIFREDGVITISLEYAEVFYLTWQGQDYDVHTFHFNPKSQGRIS